MPKGLAIESCLALLASVVPNKGIYLSTPITSGHQLLLSSLVTSCKYTYGSSEYWSVIEKEVIPENCKRGSLFAQRVRAATSDVVIDPSTFFHCSWNQDDYLTFWRQVIEKYCKEVWFNEYWYFSSGCTYEYFVALEAGISCKDHLGVAILKGDALSLISNAIDTLEASDISTIRLQDVYKRLATDEAC